MMRSKTANNDNAEISQVSTLAERLIEDWLTMDNRCLHFSPSVELWEANSLSTPSGHSELLQ
jgi:hypothetical protein